MKLIKNLIAFGVVLGAVIMAIQNKLKIDEEIFIKNYFKIAFIIIGIIFIFGLISTISKNNKMKSLNRKFKKGEYREFLDGMEKLFRQTKDKRVKDIIRMNLSAGYLEIGEYERALITLKEIDEKNIKSEKEKLVYNINLFLSLVRTNQTEEGETLYRENYYLFENNKHDKEYGGSIALIKILIDMIKGDYKKAKIRLYETKNNWQEPRFVDDFKELEEIIEKKLEGEKKKNR